MATLSPDEPPTRIPSSRASRRAIAKESRSVSWRNSSIQSHQIVVGTLSPPMPSTLYGVPSPRFRVRKKLGESEPTGSPAMTRMPGFRSFRNLPAPLIVPPVPAPATKCVMRPLGLLPDLGTGGAIVRFRIRLVVELVREDRARRVVHDPLRLHHVVLGMIGRHRGRRDHHLGPERLEQAHLLLRHLVGHREDAAVALERRRDREPDAGVAARCPRRWCRPA